MSIATLQPRSGMRPRTFAHLLELPGFYWAIIGLYPIAHIVLRIWETPNIAKNDVQEAISAQVWAWGYHPRNPPLHTWLVMSSYAVFGVRLMAHVVLKYVLLGGVLGFAYLCGRRLLPSRTLAALSALSLTLMAPFAWTVHTALTHTLLLAALNLATLWAALRLTSHRRLVDYLIFGVMIALGFLAKYSFALFFIPLIAAMCTQAELRRALLDKRILLSIGVALTLFAPHGLWMLDERFDFLRFLAEKQRSEIPQPYFLDIVNGLGALTFAALSFLVPLLFIVPIVFRRAFRVRAMSPWASTMALLVALSLGLLLLDVLVLRATQFEQRYMMCALLAAPLAVFQRLDPAKVSSRSLDFFAVAIAIIAAIAFTAFAGRALLEQRSCHRCWEEMPTYALVREARLAGFVDGTIIADHYNVAGNMRLAFPNSRVFAGNYFVAQPPFAGPGQCLLVWNARNAGDSLPRAIAEYLSAQGAWPTGSPSYVNAPLLRSTRIDRLAYWIVPNFDANCRSQ